MTDTDLDAFSAAYRRLGTRLGKAVDSAALMEAFRDVQTHPLPVVEAALEHLGRTCRFMPRPVQVIEACQERSHVHAIGGGTIPPWVNPDEGAYFCGTCQDTGFVRGLECAGDGGCHLPPCGKVGHFTDPHPYTRKCSCRPTNPVLARLRDLLRRHSTSQEART